MTADIANEFQWKKGSKGTSRSFTIMQSKYRRWHLLYRITLSKIQIANISLFTAVTFIVILLFQTVTVLIIR